MILFPDGWLEWGAALVRWLQTASPALVLPAQAITELGSEAFFVLALPFLFWVIDRRICTRLLPLFLFSVYLNSFFKTIAAQPRPFEYDPLVRRLTHVGNEGFPSGHTQQTTVWWGFLAASFRRRWLFALTAALVVLVPLSRLYLGVHFPHDIVGGYLIGLALLLVFAWLQPGVAAWVQGLGVGWQVALALVVTVPLSVTMTAGFGVSGPALLAGAWLGVIVERRLVGFETGGAWWLRLLRFPVGLALGAAVYVALSGVQGLLGDPMAVRWFKYAMVGAGLSLGAPWAFVRLGLAEGAIQGIYGPDSRPPVS